MPQVFGATITPRIHEDCRIKALPRILLRLATGAAAIVPLAPVEKRATDQLTPEHATPRVVEVKTFRVAEPAASDAVAASVQLAAPVALPVADVADDGQGWMATLLGVLLMALGLVSVLGSSPILREAVLLRD